MKSLSTLTAFLIALSCSLTAQTFDMSGEVVVSSTFDIRSVQPAEDNVIVSMTQSGRQITVDVTDPQAPSVCSPPFNPAFSDQFSDGWYADVFGGRMFTAHRFGGINMLDASNPCLLSTLDTIAPGATTSNYSHEGLKIYRPRCGPNGEIPYLFYGETHTSPTGPSSFGGLRVFEVTPTNMLPISTVLNPELAGYALDVSRDGQYCYQIGVQDLNETTENRRLLVYNVANPYSPALCANIPMIGSTPSYADCDLEVNDDGTHAYAALGTDGLWVADVTSPCAPTASAYLASPFFRINGLTFFRKNILIAWGRLETSPPINFFATLNVGASPATPPIMSVHWPDVVIRDLKVENGAVYIGGTKPSGDDVLQIWL